MIKVGCIKFGSHLSPNIESIIFPLPIVLSISTFKSFAVFLSIDSSILDISIPVNFFIEPKIEILSYGALKSIILLPTFTFVFPVESIDTFSKSRSVISIIQL